MKDAPDLKEFIQQFLNFLKNEKNHATNTIISYKNDLLQFHDFLLKEYNHLTKGSPDKIDYLIIRAFVSELMAYYSRATVGRKLASLRSFFAYLSKKGIVAKNPAKIGATPKREKKLPSFLTARVWEAPQATPSH